MHHNRYSKPVPSLQLLRYICISTVAHQDIYITLLLSYKMGRCTCLPCKVSAKQREAAASRIFTR